MKQKLLITLCITLLTFTTTGLAKKRKFPRGCDEVGFTFQGNNLILTPTSENPEQTLYLLHNLAGKRIQLVTQQPWRKKITDFNWKSSLDPYRWTAFALSRKNIAFMCRYDYISHEDRYINCMKALEVCEYPRAKFAEGKMGTYWIAENSSMREIVRRTIRSGILLRW